MKKFVAVIKSGNDYKTISSTDSFDEILDICESLSKKYNTLYRGQMISDKMAQLDHEYNGKSSCAVSVKKLVK